MTLSSLFGGGGATNLYTPMGPATDLVIASWSVTDASYPDPCTILYAYNTSYSLSNVTASITLYNSTGGDLSTPYSDWGDNIGTAQSYNTWSNGLLAPYGFKCSASFTSLFIFIRK